MIASTTKRKGGRMGSEYLSEVFKALGWMFIIKGWRSLLVANVISVYLYRDGIHAQNQRNSHMPLK